MMRPIPSKCTVLNGNSVFYLHSLDLFDIFQECIPGVTHDLPVHVKKSQLSYISKCHFIL